MRRYRMSVGDAVGLGPSWYADEEPDGEWVKYEDAEAALAELRSVLREACDIIDDLQGRQPDDDLERLRRTARSTREAP